MSVSSGALKRLTNKKGTELSKFLGIDSGLSTSLIANMQARINNPLFRLSMTDYEAMCGNKMMLKMMSKVIGCNEKQLNKFCKYINVFKDNINSSPKSINNKINATRNITASKRRGSLNLLPDDIYHIIVEKYKTIFKLKYVLKDWIQEEREKGLDDLDWGGLSGNPNAIDLLKENSKKINWENLSGNTNTNAIELLKANPKKINWENLSGNPNTKAIELLKKYPEEIDWNRLSGNPNPKAIELLNAKSEKIDWENLSGNPNPKAIELLNANPEKIIWKQLSGNPNAIELLINNPEEIKWYYLSKNPNAIELIKNKINEENEMSEDELYDLDDSQKISWKLLSQNPNAIELLKDNPTKIYGELLSQNLNPEAIELLKKYPEKIDWFWLSQNLNAIELLKAHPKKIYWNRLSKNPAIFNEILV